MIRKRWDNKPKRIAITAIPSVEIRKMSWRWNGWLHHKPVKREELAQMLKVTSAASV